MGLGFLIMVEGYWGADWFKFSKYFFRNNRTNAHKCAQMRTDGGLVRVAGGTIRAE